MSKSIKTFSVLARPIIRSHPLTRPQHSLLRQNGPVSIQPVRFRNPPLRYGRILRVTAQFALTGLMFYLVSGYLLVYEEEENGQAGAETTAPSIAATSKAPSEEYNGTQVAETEQVEELLVQLPEKLPEDAIFIPLWWGKERPRKFYKGSDPEWQGYVKFARNPKKVRGVQRAMALHVQDSISKNPHWTKFLGKPVRLTRYWLDYDFPRGPPPEFDRPGIEIADDYVALTSRPQSFEQYTRVKAALWPDAITKSFYTSLKMYWSLQYVRLKGYLNLQAKAEEPSSQATPNALNLHKLAKVPEKEGSRMDKKLDKLSDPKAADTETTSADSTGPSPPRAPASGRSSESAKILSYLPSLKKSEGDLGSAVNTFKRTLAHSWRDIGTIDRGAVVMSGFVEVDGPKAKLVVDVNATFHPETNELKVFSIRLRRASPRHIAAQG